MPATFCEVLADLDGLVRTVEASLPDAGRGLPDGARVRDLGHGVVGSVVRLVVGGLEAPDGPAAGDLAALVGLAGGLQAGVNPSAGISAIVRTTARALRRRLLDTSPSSEEVSVADVATAVGRLDDVESAYLGALDVAVREAVEDGVREKDVLLRKVIERRFDVEMAVEARRLGLELSTPLLIALLVNADEADETTLAERSSSCARSLPVPPFGHVLSPPSPPFPAFGVVVVSSGRETDLVDALGDACKRFDCVGAYAIADSPGVVATTFAALKPVAVVAARCARHLGPAFDLDAAMPFLLASRVPPRTQDHLVGKHLGPLLRGTNAKHARKQIATLEAWYAADHKTQDAAAALHVGVQGLRARMRRIQELTGLDPRHHRLSFEVAIALYRLFEDEWEAPGGPRWNGDAF